MHLQQAFPFVLTKKSGVTKELAESLFWYKSHGIGFSVISSKLRERYAYERDRLKLVFYSLASCRQSTFGAGALRMKKVEV